MKPALQIYSTDFDADFFKLPKDVRTRIESAIDRLGANLKSHPHRAMQGVDAFRLRVGPYRVIYDFDLAAGRLHLLAIGHRREVYRRQ